MTSRTDYRKQLRTQRLSISDKERSECAQQLYKRVSQHPFFLNSKRIAAYLPANGEADTKALIERAWQMNKQVYVPVLMPFLHNRLWFIRYRPDTRLVKNRFGIAEPESIHHQRIAPYALDLVLTPLLGFDRNGNRLGMGGGFYDRSFAFLLHRQHWIKPRLLGIGYDFQCIPNLPHQPWDVPLTAIATDQNWYDVAHNA